MLLAGYSAMQQAELKPGEVYAPIDEATLKELQRLAQDPDNPVQLTNGFIAAFGKAHNMSISNLRASINKSGGLKSLDPPKNPVPCTLDDAEKIKALMSDGLSLKSACGKLNISFDSAKIVVGPMAKEWTLAALYRAYVKRVGKKVASPHRPTREDVRVLQSKVVNGRLSEKQIYDYAIAEKKSFTKLKSLFRCDGRLTDAGEHFIGKRREGTLLSQWVRGEKPGPASDS